MSEERLYQLAHEALLERWSRRYEDVQNYPGYEFFMSEEKKLWNELLNLESEMKLKGIK